MRCSFRPLPFEMAVSAVDYDESARRFLLRAKNGHRPEILRPLGDQLATAVLLSRLAEGIDGIVPVPSALSARWRRGFNPAGVLARQLSKVTGRPLFGGLLRRRGLAGPSVKRLKLRARWMAAGRSFATTGSIPGLKLLLVDDVLTTGATAAACGASLRAAGAVEVRVAVWARTPPAGSGFDHPMKCPL